MWTKYKQDSVTRSEIITGILNFIIFWPLQGVQVKNGLNYT